MTSESTSSGGKPEPRWRELHAFVAAWYAEPLGEGDPAAFAERFAGAEARIGRPLPEALREWYRRVLPRQGPVDGVDGFRTPEELVVKEGLVELVPGYELGFGLGDFSEDPVVLRFDEPSDQLEPHAERLSEFLSASLAWQTVLCLRAKGREGPLGALAAGARGVPYEPEEYDEVPLSGELLGRWPVSEDEIYGLYRWGESCLVVVVQDEDDCPEELTVAAPNPAALAEIQAAIDAEIVSGLAEQEAEEQARKDRLAAERVALQEGEPTTDQGLVDALGSLQDKLLRFQRATFDDLASSVKLKGELTPGQRTTALKLLKTLRAKK